MTIPSSETGVSYGNGNGVADTFNYNFKIELASDLLVTQTDALGVDTVLALTTDYTVAGAGDDGGGTITLVAGALASGLSITIEDNVPSEQLTPFGNQSSFQSDKHEDAYDKGVRITKKALRAFDRAFTIPQSSASGVSTELPKPAALSLVRWNSDANALEAVTADDIATTVEYSNWQAEQFVAGVDFTAGVTTQLTVANAPGVENNTQIYFDGVYQPKTAYTLSTKTITFGSAIGGGVSIVEIVYGTAAPPASNAAAVVYSNTTSGLTATNVQAAIDEIQGDAAALDYDNTTSGMTATTVKAALDELAGEVLSQASPPISSDATVDFTAIDTTAFDTFVFDLTNVIPATDDVSMNLLVSTSGTFNTGASDYMWGVQAYNPFSDVSNNNGHNAAAAATICFEASTTFGVGSAAGEDGVSGRIIVYGLGETKKTSYVGYLGYFAEDGGFVGSVIGGNFNTAEANDGVRFLFSSGNLETGTISMHGVKH